MNITHIELHIDKLLLHGFAPGDRYRIGGAVEHELARLNLTGGSIHNVALSAAFLAARAGTPVTMPLIFEAARKQFRKLEKPVNEGDFRSLKPVGVQP